MFGASWREFAAELLGTFVLMVFGLGVNAQVNLGDGDFGTWYSINIGWGLAVVLGVYVAGGITGAHINPAVTIGLFSRGAFPANKVVPFIAAQMLGALIASAVVFVVYREALDDAEERVAIVKEQQETIRGIVRDIESARDGQEPAADEEQTKEDNGRPIETAGIWATYPRKFGPDKYLSNVSGFLDQVVGTALLLLCICAISDKKNLAPESNLGPLIIGGVVFMIGMAFGSNAGYAINPARDLGPRLFTLVGGWGTKVFETPNGLWWLVPVVGPCVGGVLGVWIYKLLIENLHSRNEPRPDTKELS